MDKCQSMHIFPCAQVNQLSYMQAEESSVKQRIVTESETPQHNNLGYFIEKCESSKPQKYFTEFYKFLQYCIHERVFVKISF